MLERVGRGDDVPESTVCLLCCQASRQMPGTWRVVSKSSWCMFGATRNGDLNSLVSPPVVHEDTPLCCFRRASLTLTITTAVKYHVFSFKIGQGSFIPVSVGPQASQQNKREPHRAFWYRGVHSLSYTFFYILQDRRCACVRKLPKDTPHGHTVIQYWPWLPTTSGTALQMTDAGSPGWGVGHPLTSNPRNGRGLGSRPP